MRAYLFLVCLALMLVGHGHQALAARHALVIGNDAYANVPKLQKAVADAQAIAVTLTGLGFNVTKFENLGRTAFNFAIQDFVNGIQPGEEAVVFYAGHGVEIGGLNYLLPVDIPEARPGHEAFVRSEAIGLSAMFETIRERSPRVTVLIIDACRDNPFALKTGRSVGATRGLARLELPQGSFMIYSAGTGQAALDRLNDNDPDPNSVFTRTLIPMLRESRSIRDIAQQTKRRVNELAASIGHLQIPSVEDELLGEFAFSGEVKTDDAAGQPPAPAAAGDHAADLAFWNAAAASNTKAAYDAYLQQFPAGQFAPMAKIRLTELSAPTLAPPPSPSAVPPADNNEEERTVRLEEGPAELHAPKPRGGVCRDGGDKTVCVSSVLKAQFGNQYGPGNLLDGSGATAWVEGRNGDGKGEWMLVDFGDVRSVSAIRLRNGYGKNNDIYAKNGRVSSFELRFSDGSVEHVAVRDTAAEQTLRWGRTVKARWIKITVTGIYRGWKYKDLAVSGLDVEAN